MRLYFLLILLVANLSSFAQFEEEDLIGGSWIAQGGAIKVNGMPFQGLVLETDTAGFFEEFSAGTPSYYTRADWRLDNGEIRLSVISSEGVWTAGETFRFEYVYSEKDDWLILVKGNSEYIYERLTTNP